MDFFNRLAKPVKILAPMVGHSENAWRKLARRYGADICYTEMVHAEMFLRTNPDIKCNRWFTTDNEDRPLVVQMCGNNAELMLRVAKKLEECCCDAIDINFGCPQNIAKRGKYGSFLQEDWALIREIVSLLSKNLRIPLFCKIRIFDTVEKTVEYAKMFEASGCSLLAVHGRTRDQKGGNTGLASWKHIKAIKEALKIPVIANGNVFEHADIADCIAFTKCDGVMVAETHLYNPLIFSGRITSPIDIFNEYLTICESMQHQTNTKCIKSHFFKIFHKIFEALPHLRDKIEYCQTLSDYKNLVKVINDAIEILCEEKKRTLLVLHPKIRNYERKVPTSTFF